MKLQATKALTYGTRMMQAGDLFKASDVDGAVMLANGQARVAPRGAKEVQPKAAEPPAAPAPAEQAVQPEAAPRRTGRRNRSGPTDF
jgi:hypothetical protein